MLLILIFNAIIRFALTLTVWSMSATVECDSDKIDQHKIIITKLNVIIIFLIAETTLEKKQNEKNGITKLLNL